MGARVSQDIVEVLSQGTDVPVRVSQLPLEVLVNNSSPVSMIGQYVIEVLVLIPSEEAASSSGGVSEFPGWYINPTNRNLGDIPLNN